MVHFNAILLLKPHQNTLMDSWLITVPRCLYRQCTVDHSWPVAAMRFSRLVPVLLLLLKSFLNNMVQSEVLQT